MYEIESGEHTLRLEREKYEDIYYALPIDPSNLLLLLNETLLDTQEERETLEAIVENEGGVESSMKKLITRVSEVEPGEPEAASEEKQSEQEDEPVREAEPEDEPEVVGEEMIVETDQSGTMEEETGKEDENDEDIVDLVLEGEEEEQESGSSPGLVGENSEAPSEGTDRELDLGETEQESLEDSEVDKISVDEPVTQLVFKKNEDDTFDLIYGERGLRFPFEMMQKLFLGLPDNNAKMFKMFLKDILDSQAARSIFRSILQEAGGITSSLQVIREKLEERSSEFLPT